MANTVQHSLRDSMRAQNELLDLLRDHAKKVDVCIYQTAIPAGTRVHILFRNGDVEEGEGPDWISAWQAKRRKPW